MFKLVNKIKNLNVKNPNDTYSRYLFNKNNRYST